MELISTFSDDLCLFCHSTVEKGQIYLTSVFQETVISISKGKNTHIDTLYAQEQLCESCSRKEIPIELKNELQILVEGQKLPENFENLDKSRIVHKSAPSSGKINFHGILLLCDMVCAPDQDNFNFIEYGLFKNPFYRYINGLLLYNLLISQGINYENFIKKEEGEFTLDKPSQNELETIQNISHVNETNLFFQGVELYQDEKTSPDLL